MKIEVNVSKAYFFSILGAMLIIAGVIGVIAYGTSEPSKFGHSFGEIEGVQKEINGACPAGKAIRVIRNDGSVLCQSVSGGTGADSPITYTRTDYFTPSNDWEVVGTNIESKYSPAGSGDYNYLFRGSGIPAMEDVLGVSVQVQDRDGRFFCSIIDVTSDGVYTVECKDKNWVDPGQIIGTGDKVRFVFLTMG